MRRILKGTRLSFLASIILAVPTVAASNPDVLLNEVMFDAPGAAGTDGSWQWVELAILQQTQFDSSWTLNDGQGSAICSLPDLTLPAGSFLLVLLGPSSPDLTNLDPSSGPIVLTSGQGWGDHLGVTSGGVQLQHGGQIRDEIYWGGSLGQPLFQLSLASGQLLDEGESIGRNSVSQYTGAASDWAIAGGPNANGPTPSKPNIVELPEEEDLVLLQDTAINSILLGLSMSFTNPGWMRVTESTPTVYSYSASESNDLVDIVVAHSFDVFVDGVAHTLSGNISTTFRRDTGAMAVSESYLTTGTLTSPDGAYLLGLSLSEVYGEAHATSRTFAYSTDYTWRNQGNSYPVAVAGTITTSWNSKTVQVSIDNRQAQDFGGAGTKTASGAWTRTRLGDGRYSLESTLTRSFPSLLPNPGESQSWAHGQQEVLYQDVTFERDAFGGTSSATITRYEQYIDGSLWARLQDQMVGTMSFDQSALSEEVTVFGFEMNIPLRSGSGSTFDHRLVLDATNIETPEKEVTKFTLRSLSGNQMPWELEGAVDPPIPSVQVAGCAACAAKAARKKAAGKNKLWKKVKMAAITTATCAGAGLVSTMTLGSVAGKKAAIRLIGKAAAKKAVPVVGWVCLGACAIGAIGDWNWGDE